MQHVVWLETASQDLDEILGYIEDRNLLAALNLQESIEHAASQLPFHPYLYRLGRVPGTRETISDIVMEVTDDKALPKAERKRLQIEHVAHASYQAKLVKLADIISNLRDIAECPPTNWDVGRKKEYYHWAKKIVDQARGSNAVLERIFDDI